MARISRVVVHPEFRGLNLGKKLTKHAFRFVKDHWQLGKHKPPFVEITADMLKFVPFAQRAGMTFVGYTQGNLMRVRADLKYLIQRTRNSYRIRNLEIPDMQGKYAAQALTILNGNTLTLESFLGKLSLLRNNDMDPKAYSLLNRVVRFPKPTLMKGLTKTAQRFLKQRVAETGLSSFNPGIDTSFRVNPISQPIRFQNVSLSFTTKVNATDRTCAIQEAFGIRPTRLGTPVFEDLNLEIRPREILLVCGSSGSGKTAFLDLLTGALQPTNHPHGAVIRPIDSKIGSLKPLPQGKPLIEYERLFGRELSDAIYVLNMAGLSEAYLYLRRFNELSEGQKYRAMIARLLNSRCNIWVADDFLSTLDSVTSNIVAENLQRFARSIGATVIVAAPHYETFARSLRPDRILMKSHGWKSVVYGASEFFEMMGNARLLGAS